MKQGKSKPAELVQVLLSGKHSSPTILQLIGFLFFSFGKKEAAARCELLTITKNEKEERNRAMICNVVVAAVAYFGVKFCCIQSDHDDNKRLNDDVKVF